MWQDPIVEEIHQIRHQLAAQCNNDLSQLVQRAMQRQEDHALQIANVSTPAATPSKGQSPSVQLPK